MFVVINIPAFRGIGHPRGQHVAVGCHSPLRFHNPAVGKMVQQRSVNGFIHTQLFFICLRLFNS